MIPETKDEWQRRRAEERARTNAAKIDEYDNRIENRRARIVAGMGFWRLACVIAVGILLAQLVSGAVTWALGYLLHPPQ